MLKTLKQLKVTFTSVSLLILLFVSLILFLAQMASAQTGDGTPAVQAVPLEVRSAQQAERQQATRTEETTEAQSEARTGAPTALQARLEVAREARTEFAARRAARAADLTEKRAEIQARKEAQIAKLQAQAQERVTMIAERATAHLATTIDRLRDISERLRVRAEALEEADTTTVIETLDSVDVILADASAALTTLDVEVEYVVTSDTPRTDWSEARAQFVAIRNLVKEAHGLLREAFAALRDMDSSEPTESEETADESST